MAVAVVPAQATKSRSGFAADLLANGVKSVALAGTRIAGTFWRRAPR